MCANHTDIKVWAKGASWDQGLIRIEDRQQQHTNWEVRDRVQTEKLQKRLLLLWWYQTPQFPPKLVVSLQTCTQKLGFRNEMQGISLLPVWWLCNWGIHLYHACRETVFNAFTKGPHFTPALSRGDKPWIPRSRLLPQMLTQDQCPLAG